MGDVVAGKDDGTVRFSECPVMGRQSGSAFGAAVFGPRKRGALPMARLFLARVNAGPFR
jgi:hypothetical protein